MKLEDLDALLSDDERNEDGNRNLFRIQFIAACQTEFCQIWRHFADDTEMIFCNESMEVVKDCSYRSINCDWNILYYFQAIPIGDYFHRYGPNL